MRRFGSLLFLLVHLTASPALAVQPDEVLRDPTLETRARALSRELRCMVCQNQSIDDSDAPLARDLRIIVRERLQAGDTDPQVLEFLVARYGDFVLLKPPFIWETALLWLISPLALLVGAVGFAIAVRRRRVGPTADPSPLSKAEQARLAELTSRQGK
jgi:cytochrome c-type biogenesis protein CcmH